MRERRPFESNRWLSEVAGKRYNLASIRHGGIMGDRKMGKVEAIHIVVQRRKS